MGTSMDRTTPSMTLCPKWIFEYDRFFNMFKAAIGSWVFIPNQNINGGITWWLKAKSFNNDCLFYPCPPETRVPLRARYLFICTIDSKIKFTVFHTCALICIPLILIWEHKLDINKQLGHFEQFGDIMEARCLYSFTKFHLFLHQLLPCPFYKCPLIFTSVQYAQIEERIQ